VDPDPDPQHCVHRSEYSYTDSFPLPRSLSRGRDAVIYEDDLMKDRERSFDDVEERERKNKKTKRKKKRKTKTDSDESAAEEESESKKKKKKHKKEKRRKGRNESEEEEEKSYGKDEEEKKETQQEAAAEQKPAGLVPYDSVEEEEEEKRGKMEPEMPKREEEVMSETALTKDEEMVAVEPALPHPVAKEPALPHPSPLSSKFKSSFSQILVEPGLPTLPTLIFDERTAELVAKVSTYLITYRTYMHTCFLLVYLWCSPPWPR
jgi:hypothetical protein